MKILYGTSSMTQDDYNLVRSIIYNNTITTMQTILEYCDTFDLKGQVLPENMAHYDAVMAADEQDELTETFGAAREGCPVDRRGRSAPRRASGHQTLGGAQLVDL